VLDNDSVKNDKNFFDDPCVYFNFCEEDSLNIGKHFVDSLKDSSVDTEFLNL